MEIIRKNIEKGRTVFFNGTHYVKVWDNLPTDWIHNHVALLHEHNPGYVASYGSNWISYNIIPGVPASTFNHTPEFIKRIYNFCIGNIKETSPYAHGDWSLSNMLINGDRIVLCDWDNLGIYPKEEVESKMTKDLIDAFGIEAMQHVLPSLDPSADRLCPNL